MGKKICETCRWLQITVLGVDDSANTSREYLECRKNAPELTLKNTDEDCSGWPIVKREYWCGSWEWEAK